jgi:hypothetical protein
MDLRATETGIAGEHVDRELDDPVWQSGLGLWHAQIFASPISDSPSARLNMLRP